MNESLYKESLEIAKEHHKSVMAFLIFLFSSIIFDIFRYIEYNNTQKTPNNTKMELLISNVHSSGNTPKI